MDKVSPKIVTVQKGIINEEEESSCNVETLTKERFLHWIGSKR